MKARCSGWSLSIVPSPSSVVIAPFAAADTGTEHERADLPSISTVHAPHWASPQPNFGPFSSRSLRRTYRSGVSGATEDTFRVVPFTRNVKSAIVSSGQGLVLGREAKAYTTEAAESQRGSESAKQPTAQNRGGSQPPPLAVKIQPFPPWPSDEARGRCTRRRTPRGLYRRAAPCPRDLKRGLTICTLHLYIWGTHETRQGHRAAAKAPGVHGKSPARRALPRHLPGPGHRRDRSARGREGRSGGSAGTPARQRAALRAAARSGDRPRRVERKQVIVLDTHALVWWVADAARLSVRAQRAIGAALREGPVTASAISLFEIATAVRRRRLVLGVAREQWLGEPRVRPELHFEPISARIGQLAGSVDDAAPGDPADRIIAATAIALESTLVTAYPPARPPAPPRAASACPCVVPAT